MYLRLVKEVEQSILLTKLLMRNYIVNSPYIISGAINFLKERIMELVGTQERCGRGILLSSTPAAPFLTGASRASRQVLLPAGRR